MEIENTTSAIAQRSNEIHYINDKPIPGFIEIYKITNLINGKIYIGQTRQGLKKRFAQHGCPGSGCHLISKAIRRYGKKNFRIEVLTWCINQESANRMEIAFIKHYDSANKNKGYNLALGGSVSGFNEETRKKMSEAHKGNKNYFYGKHHNAEAKRKMSLAKKGKVPACNPCKPIMCVETGIVYESIEAAQRAFKNRHIGAVCRGDKGRKTACGYHWEFIN